LLFRIAKKHCEITNEDIKMNVIVRVLIPSMAVIGGWRYTADE